LCTTLGIVWTFLGFSSICAGRQRDDAACDRGRTHSFEQLSWQFIDVIENGGRIALVWDDRLAWVPFEVARDP
jgi:hypothetical protein